MWAGGSCAVFLRGVDGGDPDFFQLRAFAGRFCVAAISAIHDYRFPESASFKRKEQGVSEEEKSKIDKSLSKLVDFGAKKNTDRPEGQSVFLVGEDGFPLTGINFDSIFRAKKNTNHPKRVIGIFGGGRWISPDEDKLRLHLPRKEKYQSPKRVIGIFVFGDRNYWHPVTMRFPVCFKKFF